MPAQKHHFSKRQAEVLRLVSGGKSDKEIAATLGIDEETVANHLRLIFTRLRVSSRLRAVLRWKRL